MKKYKMSKELSAAIKDLSVYKIHPGNVVRDCTAFLKQCDAEQKKLMAKATKLLKQEFVGKYFMTVDKSAKSKPTYIWHFEDADIKWSNSANLTGSCIHVMNTTDRRFFYLNIQAQTSLSILLDSLNKLNFQEITKAEHTAKLKELQKKANEYLVK